MEKNVFPQPEVATFFNQQFINIESFDDARKPDAATKELRERFGIVSNPTFIFIDSTGSVIHKSGYREKGADFLLVGQQALSSDNHYRSWLAQVKAGKADSTLLLKYLGTEQKAALYNESGYVCEAQRALDQYFNSIPVSEYVLPANWDIIRLYVANPYSSVFQYLMSQQAVFNNRYGSAQVNKVIYEVLFNAWSGNTGSDAFKKAEQAVRQMEHPMARLLVRLRDTGDQWRKIGVTQLTKDPSTMNAIMAFYDSAIQQYPNIVPIRRVYDINEDLIEHAASNTAYIKKAGSWLEKLIKVSGEEDYDYYQTLAKTYALTGAYDKAIMYQEKSVQLAIADELKADELQPYKENLETFKKAIKGKN
jgi:tetratricopeptide (TPR) repeat protein